MFVIIPDPQMQVNVTVECRIVTNGLKLTSVLICIYLYLTAFVFY